MNGTYRTELAFYNELAHTLAVRSPVCYVARYDDAAPAFVLIMEDLARSRQGDQFVGLSRDEAAIAVQQAVGLHAPRWADPTLAEFAPWRPVATGTRSISTQWRCSTETRRQRSRWAIARVRSHNTSNMASSSGARSATAAR
jgi:hypothetical protein